MQIDYVLPFVDNSDEVWQGTYNMYSAVPRYSRARDWDTLRYQLRSVEKYLPWVNNIYIILSIGETQIPKWLNTEHPKVRIVYDWEIVPEEYLPTFNSNTIDLFAPRIKELNERYLYGCDDYIITRPRKQTDYFTEDGKVILRICQGWFKDNIYGNAVANSVAMLHPEDIARETREGVRHIICPWCNHTLTPNLRSENLKYLKEHEETIKGSLTRFREKKNLTWLIYALNMRQLGLLKQGNLSVNLHRIHTDDDIDNVSFDGYDMVVLNDNYKGNNWLQAKDKLVEKMQEFLPDKSEFEV